MVYEKISVNHFPKHAFCSLSALFLCSFSALSLCRPRSGLDEVVDEVGELVVEGGAVGLELGSERVEGDEAVAVIALAQQPLPPPLSANATLEISVCFDLSDVLVRQEPVLLMIVMICGF
uniref:Secreted protein n=1 Tax=Fagus sylvatica TaxID=28930 RepID=A0A2N9F3F7_FAGSY